MTLSGGNVTASFMLDGAARVTAGASVPSAPFNSLTQLSAGAAGSMPAATLAHIAFYSGTVAVPDVRIQAHYNAGANGFEGERSDQRIARYARLAGIPAAETSI